jgi:hypothetical protein
MLDTMLGTSGLVELSDSHTKPCSMELFIYLFWHSEIQTIVYRQKFPFFLQIFLDANHT